MLNQYYFVTLILLEKKNVYDLINQTLEKAIKNDD